MGVSGSVATRKKKDLKTLEGLRAFARSRGLTEEAEEAKPKLSTLQRVGKGLTAFETGNAFYQSRYNDASFFETFGSDVKKGLTEAFTGDIIKGPTKKTFKDIMTEEGFNDRPGKIDPVDIVGLAGDIMLDPSTYLGGFVGKGVFKGAKVGAGLAKKVPVAGKIISGVEEGAKQLFKPRHEIFKTLEGKTVVTSGDEALAKMARKDRKGFRGEKGKLIHEAGDIPGARKGEDVAKEFEDTWLEYIKGGRSLQDDFMTNIAELARPVTKKFGRKGAEKAGARIGIAREAGARTGDPLLDETLNSLVKMQESMALQEGKRKILKSQLDDYMHHTLTPEASDWMAQGGDIAQFTKPIRTKVKAGFAKQRKLTGSAAEINAKFKEVHGFNLFEENAFKAFAHRGLKSIKAVRTHDFLARIGNNFGMTTKKGMREVDGKKIFKDEYGVNWTETGLPQLKGTMIPQAISDHITKVNNLFTNDKATDSLIKYYDKALRIFKGSVTGWFPAFHTRNAMGGMFNNFIEGLHDPMLYTKNLDIFGSPKLGIKPKADNVLAITTKTGEEITYGELRQLSKDFGVVGQTGYLDVAEYLTKEISPSRGAQAAKLPQFIMGKVENGLRMPLFVDGLKKGMPPIDAAKRVMKVHFDYMPEGFTAFEKNVMKRIIPFYTWTRHNIPLQIEQLIAKPGKYAGVFKAQRSWGAQPTTEEEGVLPIWLKERFTVKSEGGYWSGVGIPLEEATEKLSQPLRGFGISMSPFIKVPIEQLTGFNIFKDMKIDKDRHGKYYKNVPVPMKRWLKMKEFRSKGKTFYTVDPRRKYWLEVIGMRGWNTALRLMNGVDDKKNYLSLITTIKRYDYTLEDMKKWSDLELRQELEQALLRSGELAEFRRTFIPKGRR